MRKLLSTASLAAALFAAPVQAAVIFDQPVDPANVFNGWCSPCAAGNDFRVYADFSLAGAATVRAISFYAHDFRGNFTNFSVTFFASDRTTVLQTQNYGPGDWSRTASVNSQIFVYEANVAPLALAAGTTYWVSVFGTDTSLFAWGSENFGATTGTDVQVDWPSNTLLADDRYVGFTLYGTAFGGGNEVSEPATLALLGAGLLGLAAVRRRRG